MAFPCPPPTHVYARDPSRSYYAWLPWLFHWQGGCDPHSPSCQNGRWHGARPLVAIDLYPLPGSPLATYAGAFKPTNSGFSWSALAALGTIGLLTRLLVYVSLRCMDRSRRR